MTSFCVQRGEGVQKGPKIAVILKVCPLKLFFCTSGNCVVSKRVEGRLVRGRKFCFIFPKSTELFIVQSRQTFDGYGAFQRQANNVLLVYFFSVCSMFVGIEIVHNVTSLASGQNNSPPNFWILLEA